MNYCSDCGRPLRDGEVCNCTAANVPSQPSQYVYQEQPAQQQPAPQPGPYGAPQQPYAQQPAYGQQAYAPKPPSPIGIFFKSFFKAPNQSTGTVVQGGMSNTLLIGGIYALIGAIYLPLLFSQFINSIFNAVVKVTPYAALEIMATRNLISLPVLQFGFTGAFCAALLVFLTALIWMLLGRGPAGAPTFKTCLAGACASSFPAAMVVALACILGYASIYLSLLLLAASLAVYLVSSSAAMQEITGVRPTWLYALLFVAALLVCVFIWIQFIDRQIVSISFSGLSIKSNLYINKFSDMFSGRGFMGMMDALDSVMYSLF